MSFVDRINQEREKLKGEFKGLCNRAACQQPDAVYYNHSTLKYYCASCAYDINEANRTDSLKMYGHDLCIKKESE